MPFPRLTFPAVAVICLAVLGCAREPAEEEREAPVRIVPKPEGLAGRWRIARATGPELSVEQRREAERLYGIGYVSASRAAPTQSGVVVHEPDAVSPGLNFYTSGHVPGAVLMDMDGSVLHEWRYEYARAFPGLPERAEHVGAEYWRRALLLEDGSVIAIFDGQGIIRVDRDSQLVWAQEHRAHHDLQLLPNGELWTLTREVRLVPHIRETEPVVDDLLAVLDSETGEQLRAVSILECFERSGEEHSWADAHRRFWARQAVRQVPEVDQLDLFHTNGLEVLDGRIAGFHPAFTSGSVLLTFRNLDMAAVVDPGARRIRWSMAGNLSLPHDPSITPGALLMVFDNHWKAHLASSVTVLDPRDGSVAWRHAGTSERPFFSNACGAAETLANGNVLITESDNGRAFEVTREGRIVWEFWNPHRGGEDGELIASLLEMVRIPLGSADWVAGAAE